MIRAEKVSFEYIRRDEEGNVEEIKRALDNVSIKVDKGSFVAVLGANGSGKSTFAKHLNAILFPSEGTVWVNGIDTRDGERLFDIRNAAGMVFQNPDNQIISSVIEEDVAFGAENLGVPEKEIRERVDRSLECVGMLKYGKNSPNRLSGGQKQRVAIAGILAMEPKCIILDEPTAMLDPKGRSSVIETMLQINREKGITIILITHHMDEVTEADRVFVMSEGRVALEGTPREVLTRVKRMRELSLEVPQVTELAYELSKEGLPIRTDVLTAEEFIRAMQEMRARQCS